MLRDPDLPDALQGMEGEAAPAYRASQEDREARLADLGTVIATKRDAAVAARKDSGIEDIWRAAEEAYLGIDDANRSEFSGSRWAKPTSMNGPITRERSKPSNKSTVFVPLTARYVDMAYAKVSEIVLPIDDKPFSITPPHIPDLAGKLADTTPVDPAQAQPAPVAPAAPGAPAMPGQPTPVAAAAQQMTRGDLLKQQVDAATARAKKEEDWIDDNWQQSHYPQEMRKVLFDAARIGCGVIKGPIPVLRKSQSFSIVNGRGQLTIEKKIRPGLEWTDVWNLFPAPGCGEDIHNGDHLFDRDFFTGGKLQGLKELKDQFGNPLYLPEQIDKVIAEGPGKVNTQAEGAQSVQKDHKHHFEVFRFFGTLGPQDMKDMGAQGAEDLPADLVEVHAIVEIVNDTVIRASINPMEESGSFPHKVVCWQRRSGYWAGIGVGERVDVSQKMINGGTRALLNNAGKSAGSQIVVNRSLIEPMDGTWDLNTGDKMWGTLGDQVVQDVRQIFMTYTVPNLTKEMLLVIDYALKLAEQSTNLPLVSQGQTGKDDPDTFGQAELQDNNGHSLLRSIAWNVDDSATEPLVQDFHEWYLLDPEVPDEDKGDFQINARGSIAMVERAIQEQTYAQLLALTVNPVWGQDPKKMFAQYLKTKRLNPDDTAYSPADLAKIQNTPPPPAPQVQVAQINAATKLHVQDMAGQQRLQEIAQEAQHESTALTAGGTTPHEAAAFARIEDSKIRAVSAQNIEASRAAAESARAEKELEIARTDGYYRMQELMIQREIAILNYVNEQKITLMEGKTQLANTAMQVRAKHDLVSTQHAFQASESDIDRAVDLHKHHTGLQADAAAQDSQQAAAAEQASAQEGAAE